MRVERIGDCTLYLGDCLDVLPTLGHVDVVVTDPPYGVELTAKRNKGGEIKASSTYSDSPDKILPLVLAAHEAWSRNTERAIVTPGTRLLQQYPKAKSIGSIFCPNGAGRDRWGFGCNNPILYYGTCPYLSAGMGARPNSFYSAHPGLHATGENKIDHPCPKPLAWMLWLVTRGSLSGHVVLDPFMGSGTTLVACAKLGRSGIGIEIDQGYFDIACKRVEEAYRQPDMFVERPPLPVQETLL